MVYVPAGVPGLLGAVGEDELPPPQEIARADKSNTDPTHASFLFWVRIPANSPVPANRSNAAGQIHGLGPPPNGGKADAAVVLSVSVAVELPEPLGVTDAGDSAHVASEGAPVQVSAIALLNPPAGVSVMV